MRIPNVKKLEVKKMTNLLPSPELINFTSEVRWIWGYANNGSFSVNTNTISKFNMKNETLSGIFSGYLSSSKKSTTSGG